MPEPDDTPQQDDSGKHGGNDRNGAAQSDGAGRGLPDPPAGAKHDISARREQVTREESFRPILGESHIGRFGALTWRRKQSARVAIVIVGSKGTLRAFKANEQPTMGELFWGGSGTVYEVDTGLHHTTIELDLPAFQDNRAFHATADVEWRVKNAEQIVADAIHDVRAVLEPPLRQRLSRITRQHNPRAVENAEKACGAALDSEDIGERYGLGTTIFLALRLNAESAAEITSIDTVNHEVILDERIHLRDKKRQTYEQELARERVRHYRELISAGDVDRFAAQLAANPDDIADVVKAIQDEKRHGENFVTQLYTSDVFQQWEVAEHVREVIGRLERSADEFSQTSPVTPPAEKRPVEAAELVEGAGTANEEADEGR